MKNLKESITHASNILHFSIKRYFTMKITLLSTLISTAAAFSPARSTFTRNMSLNAVPLANGSMSFDRVCREWRCKYSGDKTDSESLESVAKVHYIGIHICICNFLCSVVSTDRILLRDQHLHSKSYCLLYSFRHFTNTGC